MDGPPSSDVTATFAYVSLHSKASFGRSLPNKQWEDVVLLGCSVCWAFFLGVLPVDASCDDD